MTYEFVVTYRNLSSGVVSRENVTIYMTGSEAFAKYEAEEIFKSSMANQGLKLGVDYVIISTK